MIPFANLISGPINPGARLRLSLVASVLVAVSLACVCSGGTGTAAQAPADSGAESGSDSSGEPGAAPSLTFTKPPQGQPPSGGAQGGQGQQGQPSQPTVAQSSGASVQQPTNVPPTAVIPTDTPIPVPPTANAEILKEGLASSSSALQSTWDFCNPSNPDPNILLVYVPGLSAIIEPESPYYQAGEHGTYGFDYILWGCKLDQIFGESVQYTVYLPSGQGQTLNYTVTGNGSQQTWFSLPGEPLGQYTVRLDTSIGGAELNFSISAPAAPLIRAYCHDFQLPLPQGADVVLVGFLPNELIQLRRYSGPLSNPANFVSSTSTSVNSSGVGYVPMNLSVGEYVVAIGGYKAISTNIEGSETAVSAYDRMDCP